jgi:hypothetical protein
MNTLQNYSIALPDTDTDPYSISRLLNHVADYIETLGDDIYSRTFFK